MARCIASSAARLATMLALLLTAWLLVELVELVAAKAASRYDRRRIRPGVENS